MSTIINTLELCKYGCGQVAKFINKQGGLMCSSKHNQCPALRKKNSIGLTLAHRNGKIRTDFGGKRFVSTGKVSADFSYGGRGSHKKVLIKERGHTCQQCLNTTWLDSPITLELEHIDGDSKNNIKENLLLLCPNCHSQTPTWRRRKTYNGNNYKYNDDEIINAVQTNINLKQCLDSLNLKWGSGQRVLRIMGEYNVQFKQISK